MLSEMWSTIAAGWAKWKRGPDAASLRKLYRMSKQIASKELEKLTRGTAESDKVALHGARREPTPGEFFEFALTVKGQLSPH